METTEKTVDYANSLEQIATLLEANTPYVWGTTYEESRFLKCVHSEIAKKQGRRIFTWSCYQGICEYDPKENISRPSEEMQKTINPANALQYIVEFENEKDSKGNYLNDDVSPTIWVLKDFHVVLTPPIARQMRDIYRSLVRRRKAILIVSPSLGHAGGKSGMEPTLDKQVVVVSYELPTRKAIEERVRNIASKYAKMQEGSKNEKVKTKYTADEYLKFAMALQGLTELEIDNAIATSFAHLDRIDESKLLREKKQIIQKSDILEYIAQTPTMDDVGGLDLGKKYFMTYSKQFTKEAVDYGVDPLKGVLMTGVPGTGKSLLAKAVAAQWGLPLIKLDVGRVMGGIVGASENNMRTAIAQAVACAPCILYIDEIEKALSGTKSSNMSDGGTLARVFGTLLTAMEEGMKDIVVIATANDISALPPELIRRFNEVLFVDLPVPEERQEVFEIHLRKRGRSVEKLGLNIPDLVKATHNFTGSEIEKAVKEGIARAFQSDKKDVEQSDIIGAIKDTRCIARVMKEQIDAIREWARDRARYASSLAQAAAAPGAQKVMSKGGKELDMGSTLNDLDELAVAKDDDLDRFEGAIKKEK